MAERACGLKGTAACKTVTEICNYVTSAECNAITINVKYYSHPGLYDINFRIYSFNISV